MFTTKESILALLTGAVAGLAAGLLLAPQGIIQSRRGLAYRISEAGQDEVDLGGSTTAPMSEISEDFGQLEALRSQLESGQS